MLKNVNILLKRAGDTSVNIRNRNEVIAAISCYGKLLKNNSQKNVSKFFNNNNYNNIIIFIFIEFTRYEKIE